MTRKPFYIAALTAAALIPAHTGGNASLRQASPPAAGAPLPARAPRSLTDMASRQAEQLERAAKSHARTHPAASGTPEEVAALARADVQLFADAESKGPGAGIHVYEKCLQGEAFPMAKITESGRIELSIGQMKNSLLTTRFLGLQDATTHPRDAIALEDRCNGIANDFQRAMAMFQQKQDKAR